MTARLRNCCCGILLAVLISTGLCRGADSPVLVVDGDAFSATLDQIAGDQLQFTGAAKRAIAIKDLVRYGQFVEPRRGPLWMLSDGGSLVAELTALADDTLHGDSAVLGEVSLSVTAVVGIIVRLPGDRSQQDALAREIRGNRQETDRVVLDNGDEIAGTIESIGGESLSIAADTGKVNIELPRVSAIAFNPSLAEKPQLPALYVAIGLSDGSRLMAEKLLRDNSDITFTSLGQNWSARASSLVAMQVFGGRAVYLSDLNELSYKHVPYLSLTWPLRKDTNVNEQPLRISEKRHLKGLGMHTAARVAYKLDQPYAAFQAELAIDDSAGKQGSATCSIFVDDGSGKWQPRYTSPILRGGEKTIPVRVDLTGVKAISLLADFADHGDTLDHINWLDARLVK